MIEEIEQAARQLANAEAQHKQATATLEKARQHEEEVLRRLAALDAERDAIITRRMVSHHEERDGEILALNAADRDGLRQMLTEETKGLASASTAVTSARAAIKNAQDQLQRTIDRTEEQALAEWLKVAETAMAEALLRSRDLRTRLGGGLLRWKPTSQFADLVRIADAGRQF